MEIQSLIITLVLGAVAGWLGGQVFKGSGLGLIGNIVVGIVGGFIGYWLLPKIGLHINTGTAWLNYILTAAIGAVVLLAVINIISGRNRT
ncbi:MAG TPA: GlsB/YeaQ/YmgE family stress response membrane protein [Ferruginibacter sp.]|nr:GlsB/YeaQ/YmgE family stress response membrane protein [Ferruginibacter sp.]